MTVDIRHGDCLDVLRTLPDASVDAVVTDPPYGLGFMGKAWDDLPPGLPFARECLRVLKPGGHMLAFGGTRTWHRLACAIEDAGFEIRDSIAWLYGSGFPKSLDVSKAIDRMDASDERHARALRFTAWMRQHLTAREIDEATSTNMGGHYTTDKSQPAVATAAHLDMLRPLLPEVPEWVDEMARERTVESENFKRREVVGHGHRKNDRDATSIRLGRVSDDFDITAPATDTARTWQGWGTALKPAFEPIVVARKPLAGTVAQNVAAYGTGALNIDATRIPSGEMLGRVNGARPPEHNCPDSSRNAQMLGRMQQEPSFIDNSSGKGRWPANVVLDEATAGELDRQSGELTSGKMLAGTKPKGERNTYGQDAASGYETQRDTLGDSGGASRFFYTAKAPATERIRLSGVAHPTVKPLDLMRWLVRLVTPPDGLVLDPFAGSGTTAEAALLEGFRCIAIEREADYLPMIRQRINRRRNPVEAIKATTEDRGLFDLLDEEPA